VLEAELAHVHEALAALIGSPARAASKASREVPRARAGGRRPPAKTPKSRARPRGKPGAKGRAKPTRATRTKSRRPRSR